MGDVYEQRLETSFPLKTRKQKLKQLRKLNRDYVGLVVDINDEISIWNISRNKSLSTLIFYTRKRMNISNIQSIICLVKCKDEENYVMPLVHERIGEIYDKYKSEKDEYLHFALKTENVFG